MNWGHTQTESRRGTSTKKSASCSSLRQICNQVVCVDIAEPAATMSAPGHKETLWRTELLRNLDRCFWVMAPKTRSDNLEPVNFIRRRGSARGLSQGSLNLAQSPSVWPCATRLERTNGCQLVVICYSSTESKYGQHSEVLCVSTLMSTCVLNLGAWVHRNSTPA